MKKTENDNEWDKWKTKCKTPMILETTKRLNDKESEDAKESYKTTKKITERTTEKIRKRKWVEKSHVKCVP